MQSIYNNKHPQYYNIYKTMCDILTGVPMGSIRILCCRYCNSIIYTFRLFVMSYDNNSYYNIYRTRGILLIEANGQCFFRRQYQQQRCSSELKVFRAFKPFSTIELNAHSTEKAYDEYELYVFYIYIRIIFRIMQVKPTYNIRYYNIRP